MAGVPPLHTAAVGRPLPSTTSWRLDLSGRHLGMSGTLDVNSTVGIVAPEAGGEVTGATPRWAMGGPPPPLATESLTVLDLSNNNLRDAAVPGLIKLVRLCPALRILRLERNHLGDAGVRALTQDWMAAGGPRALAVMDLRDNDLTGVGAAAVADALITHAVTVVPALHTILLDGNRGMGDAGCAALVKSIVRCAMGALAPGSGGPDGVASVLKVRQLGLMDVGATAAGHASLDDTVTTLAAVGAALRIAHHEGDALVLDLDGSGSGGDEGWSGMNGKGGGGPGGGGTVVSDAGVTTTMSTASRSSSGAPSGRGGAPPALPGQGVGKGTTGGSTLPPSDDAGTVGGGDGNSEAVEAVVNSGGAVKSDVVDLFHRYVSSQVEAAVAERTATLEAMVAEMQTQLASLKPHNRQAAASHTNMEGSVWEGGPVPMAAQRDGAQSTAPPPPPPGRTAPPPSTIRPGAATVAGRRGAGAPHRATHHATHSPSVTSPAPTAPTITGPGLHYAVAVALQAQRARQNAAAPPAVPSAPSRTTSPSQAAKTAAMRGTLVVGGKDLLTAASSSDLWASGLRGGPAQAGNAAARSPSPRHAAPSSSLPTPLRSVSPSAVMGGGGGSGNRRSSPAAPMAATLPPARHPVTRHPALHAHPATRRLDAKDDGASVDDAVVTIDADRLDEDDALLLGTDAAPWAGTLVPGAMAAAWRSSPRSDLENGSEGGGAAVRVRTMRLATAKQATGTAGASSPHVPPPPPPGMRRGTASSSVHPVPVPMVPQWNSPIRSTSPGRGVRLVGPTPAVGMPVLMGNDHGGRGDAGLVEVVPAAEEVAILPPAVGDVPGLAHSHRPPPSLQQGGRGVGVTAVAPAPTTRTSSSPTRLAESIALVRQQHGQYVFAGDVLQARQLARRAPMSSTTRSPSPMSGRSMSPGRRGPSRQGVTSSTVGARTSSPTRAAAIAAAVGHGISPALAAHVLMQPITMGGVKVATLAGETRAASRRGSTTSTTLVAAEYGWQYGAPGAGAHPAPPPPPPSHSPGPSTPPEHDIRTRATQAAARMYHAHDRHRAGSPTGGADVSHASAATPPPPRQLPLTTASAHHGDARASSPPSSGRAGESHRTLVRGLSMTMSTSMGGGGDSDRRSVSPSQLAGGLTAPKPVEGGDKAYAATLSRTYSRSDAGTNKAMQVWGATLRSDEGASRGGEGGDDLTVHDIARQAERSLVRVPTARATSPTTSPSVRVDAAGGTGSPTSPLPVPQAITESGLAGTGRLSPKGAPLPTDAYAASLARTYSAGGVAGMSRAMQVWGASLRSDYQPTQRRSFDQITAAEGGGEGGTHTMLRRKSSRSLSPAATPPPRSPTTSPARATATTSPASRPPLTATVVPEEEVVVVPEPLASPGFVLAPASAAPCAIPTQPIVHAALLSPPSPSKSSGRGRMASIAEEVDHGEEVEGEGEVKVAEVKVTAPVVVAGASGDTPAEVASVPSVAEVAPPPAQPAAPITAPAPVSGTTASLLDRIGAKLAAAGVPSTSPPPSSAGRSAAPMRQRMAGGSNANASTPPGMATPPPAPSASMVPPGQGVEGAGGATMVTPPSIMVPGGGGARKPLPVALITGSEEGALPAPLYLPSPSTPSSASAITVAHADAASASLPAPRSRTGSTSSAPSPPPVAMLPAPSTADIMKRLLVEQIARTPLSPTSAGSGGGAGAGTPVARAGSTLRARAQREEDDGYL